MYVTRRDMAQVLGVGRHAGEIRQGSDGRFYEWVEGMNGLGNPIGFWTLFQRTGEAIRQVGKAARRVATCPGRVEQIDVDKAVRLNGRYARKLDWGANRDRVERLLGFTSKPDENVFAKAVANWQCIHGLTVDGVIGPNTWQRMRMVVEVGRAPTKPESFRVTGDASQGPFGALTIAAPDMYRFSYTFTPDDALWLARMVKGETGGGDNLDSHAVIWAMFNRFGLFTHAGSYWMKRAKLRGYKTFASHVQSYSTTLQPVLHNVKAAKRAIGYAKNNPSKFKYIKTGGYYPGTKIPKGQLEHHLNRIQKMTWSSFSEETRSLIIRALRGKIANPIGTASQFGNTYTYFKQNKGHSPKNYEEWRRYTERYARSKKWTWVGRIPNLHQMKQNAFFIDNRTKHLPTNTVQVLFPG